MTDRAQEITATILGCGSSGGVPRVGNIWGECDPHDPRNRRRRCALLITGRRTDRRGVTRVLIDTGCDVREQLLDARVDSLDGVFYTHAHADHTHGIDDLRVLAINTKRRVDVYTAKDTLERLTEAFGYCFSAPAGSPYPPILNPHTIEDGETVTVAGEGGAIDVAAFAQEHGDIVSLRFRVGSLVYSCDISGLPDTSSWAVRDLNVWIIDALRRTPHPSHLNLKQSLALIAHHAPRRAVLTNLHTDFDYRTLDAETPESVTPAFDGMVLDAVSGDILCETSVR